MLLVRRHRLGINPARNVKFLGTLTGGSEEWSGVLAAATERAHAAGLHLSLLTQYDQMHMSQPGGLDSNHCLHLFNHYRPSTKKMINKWETYNPIALHRTYERLHRQTLSISADALSSLEFEGLFDMLRASEIAPPSEIVGEIGLPHPAVERKARALLLVTRRWLSAAPCGSRSAAAAPQGRRADRDQQAVEALRH